MIELKNLSFSYENSSEAKGQLRGIDLHVKKGELVILSGRSGCGKTTLTRILNGLCPGFYPGKLEGGYSLDGEDALKMPIHRLGTMVGSVFQDPRSQFFATNTTDEIVLGMENIPLERPVMQERLNTVCKQKNIERLIDRRIFPLSSGEKQLIAIASVCAMEPKVIVLDEPSESGRRLAGVRNLLYAGQPANFGGSELCRTERKDTCHRRTQRRRQIHALPHHHRFIPGNGFGFPRW